MTVGMTGSSAARLRLPLATSLLFVRIRFRPSWLRSPRPQWFQVGAERRERSDPATDRRRRGARFAPVFGRPARRRRPVGGWSGGKERRNLESNAIQPLACFGKSLRGLGSQSLGLAWRLANPAADFGLRCIKTRPRVLRVRGVLRARALRGAHSLDVGFLGRVACLGALHASPLRDGSGGADKR